MKRLLAAALAVLLPCVSAPAANVVLDYTYAGNTSSASNFFSTVSANGQKARATVEAAADYFSEILTNSLPEFKKPDNYLSYPPGGGGGPAVSSWTLSIQFSSPSTGSTTSISNPVIPEDEYRIYVGARSIGGSTLGIGGPGGFESSGSFSYYTNDQLAEIQSINDDFNGLLQNRDQGAGNFGRWGGALAFNTNSNWNYDHTAAPTSGQNDLYSVALHELGHALGFGTSDEWNAFVGGTTFFGPESYAANGNSYPSVTGGHLGYGTQSTVYGGTASQEATMDPDITVGTRKVWTAIDAAGLADIGWQVVEPELGLPGDYNADGVVDAADYTVWRDNLGTPNAVGTYAEWANNYGATASAAASVPEPAAAVLLMTALAAAWRRR